MQKETERGQITRTINNLLEDSKTKHQKIFRGYVQDLINKLSKKRDELTRQINQEKKERARKKKGQTAPGIDSNNPADSKRQKDN